jgi:hypothetical protein
MTVESDSHESKHPRQSRSTEEGIQIDESDEQFANAHSSTDDSIEPDSNLTVERDLHPSKQQ